MKSERHRLLDLFSGVGNFSRGFEATGRFETIAFCEIDPYCRNVLARHWPSVPIYPDVRLLTRRRLEKDGLLPVDVVVGGSPCQDISQLGTRAGIKGVKSSVWSEMARLVDEIRPRLVVLENVEALRFRRRGLDTILRDLARLGYDAEWGCFSAASVGAPHRRNRIFLVAHAGCGNTVFGELEPHSVDALAESLRDHWAREPGLGRLAHGSRPRHYRHRHRMIGNTIVPQVARLVASIIQIPAFGAPPPEPDADWEPAELDHDES
jgi:DNA (cytosine-5)-methyltransferase 1